MLRFHFASLCIPRLENEYDYGNIWFKKYGDGGMDTGVDICNQYTLQYVCQNCQHEPDVNNITMREINELKERIQKQYKVTQKKEEYLLNLSLDYETGSLHFDFVINDSKITLQNERYIHLPVKNSAVLETDIKKPESLDDMIADAGRLLERRYGISFLKNNGGYETGFFLLKIDKTGYFL